MKFSLLATLGALNFDSIQATISSGSCPATIATQANFEPDRYLGRWYDMASDFAGSSFLDGIFSGDCITATYLKKMDGQI